MSKASAQRFIAESLALDPCPICDGTGKQLNTPYKCWCCLGEGRWEWKGGGKLRWSVHRPRGVYIVCVDVEAIGSEGAPKLASFASYLLRRKKHSERRVRKTTKRTETFADALLAANKKLDKVAPV